MATVGDVVRRSLQRIVSQAAASPLDDSDYADAIDALNDMMASWEAEGVYLGYTEVSTTGEQVTVPRGALRGIIANLAIEIAPDYQAPVSPGLARAAQEGMMVCRRLGRRPMTTQFPGTFPRGEGNRFDSTYYTQPYYLEVDDDQLPTVLLSLQDNSQVTTIGSSGVAVITTGYWNTNRAVNFTTTVDGRATFDSDADEELYITASVRLAPETASAQTLKVHIYVNGATVASDSNAVTTGTPETLEVQYQYTFQNGDYVEVYVENETSTDNIIVSSATLRVD